MSQEAAHILVVDDDDRLRDLLQKYLSENGFRVTAAENAQIARAKMASISFDLLVLDLMMPDEHGMRPCIKHLLTLLALCFNYASILSSSISGDQSSKIFS